MSVIDIKRNLNIDVLRIIATLMVVFAHVVNPVYERLDFFGGKVWMISFVTITLSRLAVPLFLLISGYLLTQKERSLSQNLNHTWKRLLFPCLIWSVFTYAGLYYSQKQIPNLGWNSFFLSADTTYYFLIGLSILYLLNPWIRRLIKSISRRQLQLFLFTLALLTIGQDIFSFIYQRSWINIFSYWFLCLFYFVYGQYYFLNEDSLKKISTWINLTIFAVPLFLNLIIIYAIRATGFSHDLLWESYFGPTVLISSLGMFNTIMKVNFKFLSHKFVSSMVNISNACFGVYLIHGIVLDLILHKTFINPYGAVKINLLIFLILAGILTVVFSFLLSFLIGKTKYLKIILG